MVVKEGVVKAVVVEVVVTKAAVEVDDVVGILLTSDLLFTVAIVTIPAVHIATSMTNQTANLKVLLSPIIVCLKHTFC